MRRRAARRLVLALGLGVGATGLLASTAPAQPPEAQGWWWVAGTPLGLAPPFVPEDGLYVASNPSGPEAVSALRFTVAGGGGGGTLRLAVAGETRGTVVVGLCALGAEWEPAQGGQLAEAPACEPDGATVSGIVAPDGTSVSFPVGALVRDGRLDVGIVPGLDPEGRSPTFQLPLAAPGPDALAPAGGGDPDPAGGPSAPAPVPADDGDFAPVPGPSADPQPFEPLPPSAPLAPAEPVTVPTTGAGGTGAGQVALPGAVPIAADDGGGWWRMAGVVVLAATAVAYHRLSLAPEREPRSLVAFGSPPGGTP